MLVIGSLLLRCPTGVTFNCITVDTEGFFLLEMGENHFPKNCTFDNTVQFHARETFPKSLFKLSRYATTLAIHHGQRAEAFRHKGYAHSKKHVRTGSRLRCN